MCLNSAVPSFAIAQIEFDPVGCLLGIVIFILAATFLVPTSIVQAILGNPLLRRAFLIAYGARYVVCFVPFVIAFDVFVGLGTMAAAAAVQVLLNAAGPPDVFWSTFGGSVALTIVQGIGLNIAIVVAALMLFLILRAFGRPTARPATACIDCGFDLRIQSPGDPCPECGSTSGSSAARPAIALRFGNGLLVGVVIMSTTTQALIYVTAEILWF